MQDVTEAVTAGSFRADFYGLCWGMQISKDRLNKFKFLYRKKFGQDLSDEEAYELALRFVLFFKAVYKPIPKEHLPALRELSERLGHDI